MPCVRDLMTSPVISLHRDQLVCEAEGVFVTQKITGAPLIDDKENLVGFVSKSDFVRFNFTGGDPNYASVWEIATPRIISVAPSTPIKEAARKMIEEHVHHLLVIEDDKPIGIVSALDFVELIAEGEQFTKSEEDLISKSAE